MTTKDDYLELSDAEILKEVKNLMLNEVIRPQPEYEFFSKYFAASKNGHFFEDEEEIVHLINSHGVQLINDVKYWSDKSKIEDSGEDVTKQIPVLDLKHFHIRDISDVMNILKELPSEWTVLQITKKFSPSDVTRKQDVVKTYLTRFACGDLAERIHPYSVSTEDNSSSQENVFQILKNLTEMRKEFYNLGRRNKKLFSAYYKTNTELESFIKELELYVLGPFISLFQGRLEDSSLEQETLAQVKKLINSFCEEEKMEIMPNNQRIDLIYQLTCAAHLMKSKVMFNALKLLYSEGTNVNVRGLMMLIENIKLLNLSNSCAIKRANRKPLILILDNVSAADCRKSDFQEFEMVPWEMIAILTGQPVCRISSLHLLYSLYKYHEPHIKNGFRVIDIDCTYCLINPGQDLQACEKEMKEFLKKRIPWAEVVLGKAPDARDLMSKIGESSAYLYCGHGSGIQYLEVQDLKKAFVRGLILLFGCSSNIPKSRGGRTPHQNHIYTYISNGCPCIIGCIQDLGSTDADAVCKDILSNIMPVVSTEGCERIALEPKEPDVLRALAAGRFACPKYWSKSAFVARGIPCKTAIGAFLTEYTFHTQRDPTRTSQAI